MTATSFHEEGVVPTRNSRGHTSRQLNEYGEAFVAFVREATAPVLDIGAAYGVATIPALAAGGVVIACDIEVTHLNALLAACPADDRRRLVPIVAEFPGTLRLAAGSLAAVHAANLLNYLTGPEIDQGLRSMFEWLQPGGKVFTISGTPYAANVQEVIPVYEQRRQAGEEWPGEVYDLHARCAHPSIQELPDFLHLLDDTVLVRSFEQAGFVIERAEMFERRGLPEYLRWDGRENVGLIARRP